MHGSLTLDHRSLTATFYAPSVHLLFPGAITLLQKVFEYIRSCARETIITPLRRHTLAFTPRDLGDKGVGRKSTGTHNGTVRDTGFTRKSSRIFEITAIHDAPGVFNGSGCYSLQRGKIDGYGHTVYSCCYGEVDPPHIKL